MDGVARALELEEGLRSTALLAAQGRWRAWQVVEPALGVTEGPGQLADLAGWLRAAEPREADRVLKALVRIGSPSGGDDPSAVDVVAWALLPGARALACRLRDRVPRVDERVASQLWVEVRTFPWERLGRVAANVLANTKSHLLADVLGPRARPAGRRSRLVLVDPHSSWWEAHLPVAGVREPDAAWQMADVLADAVSTGVLTVEDQRLLVTVVEAARLIDGGGACRGRGGLLAGRVVEQVTAVTGLSAATVRRRVRRSTLAVQAAYRAGWEVAA